MTDNSIKSFFRTVTDVILLNLLWILASFLGLLITTGAATTAMFRVSFQLFKQEEPTNVTTRFITSFKENFLISTLVWVALVIFALPIYIMYQYGLNQNNTWVILLAVVCAYQVVLFAIYFFPIMAILKTESIKQLLKNVILISHSSLWTNFKVMGSLLAVFLLMIYVSPMFFLVIIALYGLMIVYHLNPILKPFIEPFEDIKGKDNNRWDT